MSEVSSAGVVDRLRRLSGDRALSVGERLSSVQPLLIDDLVEIERELGASSGVRDVHRGAQHLVRAGGKRLRPMCVLLAAKLGSGSSSEAVQLAIAAELVHSATLLHDDVVDDGVARRGAPTTRVVYGNAISIFAGDWLLVDALRRVRRSSPADVIDRLLDVIDEMIVAESLQLERRGRLESTFDDWCAVATGKTAALFRWASYAGARAGGLSIADADALEGFGAALGLAFQAVDDVLDLAGDAAVTGKALFADLREGKSSLPVVLALRRDPTLALALANAAAAVAAPGACAEVAERIAATGAIEEARRIARDHTDAALAVLDRYPPSMARTALADIARGMSARAV